MCSCYNTVYDHRPLVFFRYGRSLILAHLISVDEIAKIREYLWRATVLIFSTYSPKRIRFLLKSLNRMPKKRKKITVNKILSHFYSNFFFFLHFVYGFQIKISLCKISIFVFHLFLLYSLSLFF